MRRACVISAAVSFAAVVATATAQAQALAGAGDAQRQVIAEALEQRRASLAERPDDPLAGAWMVESAELLLAELALTGADSAALVGLPTRAQRDEAERNARRALQLAEAAAAQLGEGVAAVEGQGGYAAEESLRELRRRLAVEFAMFRAPMARARARLILAGLAARDDAQRGRLAQAAQDELLDMRLPAGPAEAQRLTWLGLAELFGAARSAPPDQPLRASFPTDIPVWFDIALTLEAERPFWRLPDRERVEGTIGKGLASARGGRASAARLALENAFSQPPAMNAQGGRSAAWTLLIADGLYRVGLMEASSSAGAGSQRRALAQACEAHAWLMSLDSLGGLDREAIAALIADKVLAHAAQAGGLAGRTPLAIAAQAARDVGSGDAARLAAAIEALSALLALPRGEVGRTRASALRTLARAHAALADAQADDAAAHAEHGLLAAEALLRAAREHGEHPDAGWWARQAAALLRSIEAGVEASGSAEQRRRWVRWRREGLRLQADGLAQGRERDEARLALADAALTPSAAERLGLLEAIGADSPVRAAALARIAQIELGEGRAARALAAAQAGLQAPTLREQGKGADDAQAALARLRVEALLALDRLEEAAQAARSLTRMAPELGAARATLARAIDRLDAAWGDSLNEQRAQLLIELRRAALDATPAERTDAQLAHLRALAQLHARLGDAQVRAEALARAAAISGAALDVVAHAEALRDAGQEERAFALLRDAAQRESGEPRESRAYWRAWAGMLEMLLERARAEPAQRERVAAALARLRAIADDFGPDEDARRRLREVEAALASADGQG